MLRKPPKPAVKPQWNVDAWAQQLTPEQLKQIMDLAAVGWPIEKIADHLGVTHQKLTWACTKNQIVRDAYDIGASIHAQYPKTRLSWFPTPNQIEQVKEYAANGLVPHAIAAKFGIKRQQFTSALNAIPQLKDALEIGEGQYMAEVQEQYVDLRRSNSPALKNSAGALIFEMKSRCQLSDRPEIQKVEHSGTVKVNTTINLPEKVKVENFQKASEAELERADRLKIEQAKSTELTVVVDPVEAEVVEIEV